MKQTEVTVGKVYAVKVNGKLAPVKLIATATYCLWIGTNLKTQRTVHIHSAAKLRFEVEQDPITKVWKRKV